MKFSFKASLFIIYSLVIFALMYRSGFQIFATPVDSRPFAIMPPAFVNQKSLMTGEDLEPTFYFRGDPNRTGVNRNHILPQDIQLEWEKKPLNLGIHTASKATPAVDDSGVYVGADSSWFYAYDLQGQLKWKFFSDDAKYGFHSTAALDKRRVYIGDYKGQLYALDKESGRPDWSIRLGETIGASPILYKDTILVTIETNNPRNGYLVRLDQKNGELLWKSEYLGEQSHSSPSIDESLGFAILGANNSKLFAFDIKSGKQMWQVQLDGEIKATPMIREGVSYLPTWNGTLYAINNEDGTTLWTANIGDKAQGSVSWVPELDLLIIGSKVGKIFAFNRQSGEKRWEISTNTWSSQMTSALVIRKAKDGPFRIWIPCAEKKICSIDPNWGRIEKRIVVREMITSTLVAHNQALYIAPTRYGGLQKWSVGGGEKKP